MRSRRIGGESPVPLYLSFQDLVAIESEPVSAAIVETGSPVIENDLSAPRDRLHLHVHHARRRFVKQRTERPGEDDALARIDEGHMHVLDAPALRKPLAKTAADIGSDGK